MKNHKSIYNKIMHNISHSLKQTLNEADYYVDDYDWDVTITTSKNNKGYRTPYKYAPQTKEELFKLIIKKYKENPEEPNLLDIDTSAITDMSELFYIKALQKYGFKDQTVKIKKLDLSTWNVSNVININFMFWQCYQLKTINLSGWDTSNLVYMNATFASCTSLKSIDLSHFDISNVAEMNQTFAGCKALHHIEFFDINNLGYEVNFYDMFSRCNDLNTRGIPEVFLKYRKIINGQLYESSIYNDPDSYMETEQAEPMVKTIMLQSYSLGDDEELDLMSFQNEVSLIFRLPETGSVYLMADPIFEKANPKQMWKKSEDVNKFFFKKNINWANFLVIPNWKYLGSTKIDFSSDIGDDQNHRVLISHAELPKSFIDKLFRTKYIEIREVENYANRHIKHLINKLIKEKYLD